LVCYFGCVHLIHLIYLHFRKVRLIILYGILAIGFGAVTAALLWPLGPLLALSAAILAGALAIIGAAAVRFAALAARTQRADFYADPVRGRSSREAER